MKLLLTFFLLSFSLYSQDLEGVTTPSADVSASFTVPALVEELKVKEGQFVKKGEVLAIQQKHVEEQQLVRLRKEATATALIDKANVEIDYYTKDVESLREALIKGASSKKELNDSVLKLRTAELGLKEAQFNKEIAALKVKELESKITQYVLRSPVDGIVEKLSIEPGESPKTGEEHIRIVQVTPMWVEVPVPRNIAIALNKTTKSKVFFPDNKIGEYAKIIFISPVADTASDTVRVRLELANENKRLVGERVKVTFEAKK
ncbi:MAG: efflux RND transporter periplasmic adaptor subunit [Lentisphaeraceae bacterium]|nr:efflux RND transporter periplasmic adaptor subunit [Lentisphaeraceae bacterium]